MNDVAERPEVMEPFKGRAIKPLVFNGSAVVCFLMAYTLFAYGFASGGLANILVIMLGFVGVGCVVLHLLAVCVMVNFRQSRRWSCVGCVLNFPLILFCGLVIALCDEQWNGNTFCNLSILANFVAIGCLVSHQWVFIRRMW